MKYRKKPIIIDAIQYSGLNIDEIKNFTNKNCNIEIYDTGYQANVTPPLVKITIHTLEGDLNVTKDDYIIKGIKGEFYPCKPDIFEQTYEPIAESEG